jgi:hypothetical protein
LIDDVALGHRDPVPVDVKKRGSTVARLEHHKHAPSAQSPQNFAVDGQLLRVIPRAGATLRNPNVHVPTLRADAEGYYLELRVEADPTEDSEVAVTRRISLENLSENDWEALKLAYDALDLKICTTKGVAKGLEKVADRRLQRLLTSLMTFLNPRQISVTLYLYRLAAQQGNGSKITVRSNDLLAALGYTRTKDGGFASKLRSQLHCDLVSLHRTELVLPYSLRKGNTNNRVSIKNILHIQGFAINNVPRQFDLVKAADYTYELADSYTVALKFFDGVAKGNDFVMFPNGLDISQKLGGNAKNDYRTKLLIYLASRMKWDNPQDEQYLIISKPYIFKNLDLFGSNSSRNNQIFWRTIEELKGDGYLVSAQELTGKKRTSSIQFHLNSEKLRCS